MKILKRVLVGVLIGLILSIIRTHALTTTEMIDTNLCIETYVSAEEIVQETITYGYDNYTCKTIENNWVEWKELVYNKLENGIVQPYQPLNVIEVNHTSIDPVLDAKIKLKKGGSNDVTQTTIYIATVALGFVGGVGLYAIKRTYGKR